MKAVIFDLDGTLVNTLEDIAATGNIFLKKYNFPLHRVSDYKNFVGNGVKNLIERALPEEEREGADFDTLVKEFKELYTTHWNINTTLYEGIPGILDLLTEKKIPLAVLSNKFENFTIEHVSAYLSKWPFAIVRGAREDTPIKPHPRGAIEIAGALGVEPGECLFVGDSGVDMATARNAGMVPAGVLWGFRPEEELRKNGAEYILTTPGELGELIAQFPG